MNLAIVIGNFPPGAFGGAELQAESWAKRLSPRHGVTVVTRFAGLPQREHEVRDGFEVRRHRVSRLPLWRTLASLADVERTLRSLAPRPDLILAFQTFATGLASVRAGESLGVPAVVWIRGEAEYRLGPQGPHRWLAPGIWRRSRAVVVQSEQNRRDLLEELTRHAPRVRAEIEPRLEVIGNGLDLPVGPFTRGERLLTVGRLIPEKGMDVVIDAAAAAGLPLTIAGTGPEREALERRARARGLDCRFEGNVTRERLDALYRSARAFVLAARSGEGLPNVVLEAMAYARPVFVTPCAGVRDLIQDGLQGRIVPAGDAEALRRALQEVTEPSGPAERLGDQARRTAARFSWEAVEPQLEAALGRWTASRA